MEEHILRQNKRYIHPTINLFSTTFYDIMCYIFYSALQKGEYKTIHKNHNKTMQQVDESAPRNGYDKLLPLEYQRSPREGP